MGEHPHRGFETVTVVYQGEVEHRDSTGNKGRIGPGDVQWMTAASGIVHEEMHGREFTAKGGTMEMVQLWVNLPAKLKMSPPGYQDIVSPAIPAVDARRRRRDRPGHRGTVRGGQGPRSHADPDRPLGHAAPGEKDGELPRPGRARGRAPLPSRRAGS